jgi:hypothetical protein
LMHTSTQSHKQPIINEINNINNINNNSQIEKIQEKMLKFQKQWIKEEWMI